MRPSLLYLLLFILTACGEEETTEPAAATDIAGITTAPAKSYPTETVSIVSINRPIQVTGRVIPLQEAGISAQVPGLVLPTNKLLQEGKSYRKGEVMIRIDNEPLLFGLRADRSNLVTALVRILSDLSLDYPAEHPAWEHFTNQVRADKMLPDLPEITNEQLRYFISANGIPCAVLRHPGQRSHPRRLHYTRPL